jgi:hypothetical protein
MKKYIFELFKKTLNKLNTRVRAVDQTNILYIGHDDYWRQETNKYMKRTGVFRLIGKYKNPLNNNCVNLLKTMNHKIVSTLHHLFFRKTITTEQFEEMMHCNQGIATFEINKLYFTTRTIQSTLITFIISFLFSIIFY